MQQRNPQNAKGVDVSHWQGTVDWGKVKEAGYSFAIMKATEGTGMIDDTLAVNIVGARDVGMAVGCYHFCRASNVSEAIAEANVFGNVLDSLGGLAAIDIPPVLDIETVHASARAEVVAIAHAWLEAIEVRFGVRPMIYSFPFFMDQYLDESLSKYPLWIANYGDTIGQDRAGWTEWTFFQHTDKGKVPGIGGYVDLNEFNGSVDELINRISAEDANKIIERWLAHEYEHASDADKEERHRLANELRKASGQPLQ